MDLTKHICKTASCPAFGDWAIANKLDIPWDKHKAGDIVLFDFNGNGESDHIGIVTKVGNDYIETVEGNTGNGSNTNGDGVYLRTRFESQVNYFVRPKMPEEYFEAIIRTAKAEVGYKEGKNNANKYGKVFGLDKQPWCCIFVWWLFKNCKAVKVKAETKPVAPAKAKSKAKNTFTMGKNYVITTPSGLKVRKGAGTSYAQKKTSELTADGKKHAAKSDMAVLKKGTVVTAIAVKGDWIKCPSGWICGREDGSYYVKEK